MIDRLSKRQVEPFEVLHDVRKRVVGSMSRQASTDPKRRSRSSKRSCFLSAARVVARLTARVVQPTPPAAPVTVMIRAVTLATFASATVRPRASLVMISRSSAASAGSVRNSRAGADRLQDQAAVGLVRLAGRITALRVGLRVLDEIDRLVGVVVEDDDGQVSGELLCAVRRLLIARQDFRQPERRHPRQQPLQVVPRLFKGIDQDDSDHILHGLSTRTGG